MNQTTTTTTSKSSSSDVGIAAFKEGKYEQAIEALTQVINNASDLPTVFLTRAQCFLENKKFKAALKDSQAVTAVAPTSSKGYLLQASILRSINRYTEEVQIIQDGLDACSGETDQKLLQKALQEAKQISKSVLNDPSVRELFVLFDHDKDSTVDFKEVAVGLYRLLGNVGEAHRKAAGLLLMMGNDDKRTLSYEQFAKLVVNMAATTGLSFEQLTAQLKAATVDGDNVSDDVLKEISITTEEWQLAQDKFKEEQERKKIIDVLSNSRISKLFDLWDDDNSGTISFQEVLTGLRKYQKAVWTGKSNSTTTTPAKTDVELPRDAIMVMGHDKDSNQELDKEEFATAMVKYAEFVGADMHELIDFMCVVSSTNETAEYEALYSEATPTMIKRNVSNFSSSGKFQASLGTILDMGEADDEAEEE